MRAAIPFCVLLSWVVVALIAPWLPLHPNTIELSKILSPPILGDWLGHDDYGRAIIDRLLVGARTSFLASVSVVLVSCFIGTAVGLFAGWVGGWSDHVIIRVIDIFLAFPGILLAIALAGLLGPGLENVIIALATVGWVGFARLTRAQVLSVKHREHIQAAQALGSKTRVILVRHVLPLITAPLIIEATFGIAAVVIAEAGLSFLGLGVQPPSASWGSMIRDGTQYMLVAPHMVIAPGVAMLLVVLSVNLIGDWLRDKMDVRSED